MRDITRSWFQIVPWMDEARTGPYPSIERIQANMAEFAYFEKPICHVEIESMTLNEYFKPTDAIFENANKGGSIWIVSNKLKKILQSFKMPAHEFYKINTTSRGKSDISDEYYVFNIFEDIMDQGLIDFSLSKFKTTPYTSFLSNENESLVLINASSSSDYMRQLKEQSNMLNDIQPFGLIINNTLTCDLFGLRVDKYYVSEHLASALRNNDISGFDVLPIDFEIKARLLT